MSGEKETWQGKLLISSEYLERAFSPHTIIWLSVRDFLTQLSETNENLDWITLELTIKREETPDGLMVKGQISLK